MLKPRHARRSAQPLGSTVASADQMIPSVEVRGGCIVTSYPHASSGAPQRESIRIEEVSKIVVEQSASLVHWFLSHNSGWTLHFNEQFAGADLAKDFLSAMSGFNNAALQSAREAREGQSFVVWYRI
jgi:hypothetical protein